MNLDNWATKDGKHPRITAKLLTRALSRLPRQPEPIYPAWVGMFFTRVWFVRIVWQVRKTDRKRYWSLVRREWQWTQAQFRPHRKTWRKHMAGYSRTYRKGK